MYVTTANAVPIVASSPVPVPSPLPSPNAQPSFLPLTADVAFAVPPLAAATTYAVVQPGGTGPCASGPATLGAFTTQ